MTGKIQVPLNEARATVERCLARLGLAGDELDLVSDVLFYAQLRGNTQGFAKIVERTVAPDPDAGAISVVGGRGAMRRIDGGRNLGMVVCQRADTRTVQLGLANFFTQPPISWGAIMAYAVLATVPMVLALAAGQRWIVQSLVTTGLKE